MSQKTSKSTNRPPAQPRRFQIDVEGLTRATCGAATVSAMARAGDVIARHRAGRCMTQKQPLRILFPRARWVAPNPRIASVNSPAAANGNLVALRTAYLSIISATTEAHPQHLGQVKGRVRSGQLERDQGNVSHSRLHKQANGRDCTSQFYQYGCASPVEAGSIWRRRSPCTREPLCRLVLPASFVYPFVVFLPASFVFKHGRGSFLMGRGRSLGSAAFIGAARMTQKRPVASHPPMVRDVAPCPETRCTNSPSPANGNP
jgi:hypothetical protein